MKQIFVTINGKNYPAIFTLKTLSNFEEITNQGFFDSKFNKITERIAIVMSAVLAADKNTDLKIEDLIGDESWDAYLQINKAYSEVMALSAEFFPIPEVEKDKETKPTEETEGEKKKN